MEVDFWAYLNNVDNLKWDDMTNKQEGNATMFDLSFSAQEHLQVLSSWSASTANVAQLLMA